MAGLKQSKRVSWAPGGKLCQVRLFLSEDAPSQSGFGAQDNLQAKASWLWHATDVDSDDSLPPGFEAPHVAYRPQKTISQIPLIKWQCPPRIVLNPELLVVAGEESDEVAVQDKRQLETFEAIYPHPSFIPPDPSVPSETQDFHGDDLHTLLIPITTIEDEEDSDTQSTPVTSAQLEQPDVQRSLPNMGTSYTLPDLSFLVEQSQSNPIPDSSHAEKPAAGAAHIVEPDIMAAASAAFTAIMRSSEEGSLIDRDLLIKILSNPSLIEKLISEYGAPKQILPPAAAVSARTPPIPVPPPPPPPPRRINLGAPMSSLPTTHMYTGSNAVASTTVNRQPSPVPVIQITNKPFAHSPSVKDVSYYKSLIQQHGEEKQEALDAKALQLTNQYDYRNVEGMNSVEAMGHGSKQRDVKPKVPKPCIYFNSSKGCRHGANCLFQHDASFPQRTDMRKGAKRIKLDKGISGRI